MTLPAYKSPAFQLKCHQTWPTQYECHLENLERDREREKKITFFQFHKWLIDFKCPLCMSVCVFSGGVDMLWVNLRMKSWKWAASCVAFGILGLSLGAFCRRGALEAALKSRVSPRNLFSTQCFEQLSPTPAPTPTPTDSQGSVCCLTSIKTAALTPSPRCPSRPHHFTTAEIQSKLEEGRIKMGNLPVIPRTTAKRAICLINSLFCRSAAWPSSIFPSTRPPMRPRRARDGEVKGGGVGAYGSRKEGRR